MYIQNNIQAVHLFQCFFNINGALTKSVENSIVGWMKDQPALVFTEEAFPHPGSSGPARAFQRKQGLCRLNDSNPFEARGKHYIGGFVSIEGIRFPKFTSMTFCPIKVGFVDQNDVSQLE